MSKRGLGFNPLNLIISDAVVGVADGSSIRMVTDIENGTVSYEALNFQE